MDKKNFCLYDAAGDVSKRWFVFYYVKNATGKKERVKVYGKINYIKNADERRAAANDLINELSEKVEAVNDKPSPIKRLLSEALELQTVGLRTKTKSTYRSKLKYFIQYLDKEGIVYLHQCTPFHAQRFINSLFESHESITIDDYRDRLSALFNQISRDNNPFRDVPHYPRNSTPALAFQVHQREKLKAYIIENEPQLWMAIQLQTYCLMRPNQEVRLAKIGDIDFDRQQIRIESSIGKNKKTLWVAIPKILFDQFIAMGFKKLPTNYFIIGKGGEPSNEPWSVNYMSKKHREVLKLLGFDTTKHKFYSWKHTGAVKLVELKIHHKLIQLQGRWSSLAQLDRYLTSIGANDLTEIKNIDVEI